jgi:GTP cyclohydrolase II
MKTFSSPKRQTTAGYEEAEKDLEESGNQLILQAFGSKTFEILYSDDHNQIPSFGIEVVEPDRVPLGPLRVSFMLSSQDHANQALEIGLLNI